MATPDQAQQHQQPAENLVGAPTSAETDNPTQSGTEHLDGMPLSTANAEQAERHYKTLAVRVGEATHAQLRFIAQLSGTNISDEIRTAIAQRIATAQEDPDLIVRAKAAQAEIQREADARSAAIAGFIGAPAVSAAAASEPTAKTPASARRRTNSKSS